MIKPKIDLKEWAIFKIRWAAWTKERENQLKQALSQAGWMVATRAQTHYLTGASLKVNINRLRSSVHVQPRTGADISGNKYTVQVGTNVFYGKAWEKGFSVPATTIRPKKKKALRIPIGGSKRAGSSSFVIRRLVRRPPYTVKARPWLQPAMDDMKPQIMRLLQEVGVRFR